MQIIATVRFCFMPARMSTIIISKKQRESNRCWHGGREIGISCALPRRIRNASTTVRILLFLKILCSRYPSIHIYRHIIYNRQEVGSAHSCPIAGYRINKAWNACSRRLMLLGTLQEGNSDLCYNVERCSEHCSQ